MLAPPQSLGAPAPERIGIDGGARVQAGTSEAGSPAARRPGGRVVSGLFFFPRGGSAQVARALARALPRAGWQVALAAGSLGQPGEQTHAASFFAGIDWSRSTTRPVGTVGAPFQPSYEDRPGAPDRVFAASTTMTTSVWSASGRSARPRRRGERRSAPSSSFDAGERGGARTFPALPLVGQLHGTELALLRTLEAGAPAGWRYAERWQERMRRWARACERLIVPPGAEAEVARLLGVPRGAVGAAERRRASTASSAGRSTAPAACLLASLARRGAAGLGRERHPRAASPTGRRSLALREAEAVLSTSAATPPSSGCRCSSGRTRGRSRGSAAAAARPRRRPPRRVGGRAPARRRPRAPATTRSSSPAGGRTSSSRGAERRRPARPALGRRGVRARAGRGDGLRAARDRRRGARAGGNRRRGHRLARPTRRRGRARGRARHRCVGRGGAAAATGCPRLPPQPYSLRLGADRGAHRRALRRAPRRFPARRPRLIIGAGGAERLLLSPVRTARRRRPFGPRPGSSPSPFDLPSRTAARARRSGRQQRPPLGGSRRRKSSAAWPSRCSSLRTSSQGKGSSLGSLTSACAVSQHLAVRAIRAAPAASERSAADSGGDALRVVRATRDQLGVAWSTEADPLSWQVVCWDSRDAAVARLKLPGTHRRATFGGLARLQQPFTIAVSGLGREGSVLWQGGLADLYLRAGPTTGQL